MFLYLGNLFFECLHWASKSINRTYFGLFGSVEYVDFFGLFGSVEYVEWDGSETCKLWGSLLRIAKGSCTHMRGS